MATTNLTNLKANALSNVVSTILSTTGVSSVPKITTITYPGDDTAANTGGNQTISISGTGFNTGASVIVNGTPASVVSVVSPTSLTFTAPAQSSGTYTLYVVNTDGGTAIAVPGISYSGTPTWSTAAGSLGAVYETNAVSNTVTATGDETIAYSLFSGTLPPGSSLNTSTGLISGTSQATDSPTTYSFTIRATDGQNQDTDRAFSITINPDSVTWSSPADNSTTTVYEHSAISSISLDSTSAAGKNIAYTANSLPTGITLTGNTISGTPTVTGTSYTQLTATAATTNRTATRNIGFVVNQDVVTWNSPADQYVTSLAQNSAMTTFNMDASSAAGKSITYTANSLPTGLSVSGATIVGTPTVTGNSGSLITATAATTGRTATRTFNWVVSVMGDTYWPYNVLLLNGETPSIPFNADASTNAFAITVNGDTKPNYFNPYTPGYYSGYFDGTGDYIQLPSNAWTTLAGTFTIEFFVNFQAAPSGSQPLTGTVSTSGAFSIYFDGTRITPNLYGTGNIFNSTFTNIILGKWYHIAVTRDSSNLMTMWVDGSSVGSVTTATTYSQTIWRIGESNFNCFISNFRATNTTVYTATFTPPTAPLTAISGTSVLTCQSSRFVDNSANAFTITVNGNTLISPFQPFTPDSSYATYGSTYFDGNGDYLTLPSGNASLQPAGSDFTIEAWVYPTTFVANGNPVAVIDANASYYAAIRFGYESAGAISLLMSTNGTTWSINLGSGLGTLTLNTWQHMAVSKSGTSVRVFLNGVQQGSTQTLSSATLMTGTNNWIGYLNAPSAQYVNGYISNWRLTKTALYTTTFTPSTTPLTAIANTSLLTCQYNQPNNNSMFLDSSSATNIITRNGNATQGTFSPYGDDWSNFFDGTGDYLSIANNAAFNFSAGDFTVELWFNFTSIGASAYTFASNYQSSSAGWSLQYRGDASNVFRFSNGDTALLNSSTQSLTVNTWYHLAASRSGTSLKLFLNGVQIGSTTNSTSITSTAAFWVGGLTNVGQYFIGYTSNLRVVKGTAVYTTAFTPSTTPLTAIANTSLLTCQSNGLIDNSPNSFAITKNGDTSVQRFSPFGNYTVTPTSYSNFFDGTGDYLSVPSSTPLVLGAEDFTIEFWFYCTTSGATNQVLYRIGSAAYAPIAIVLNSGSMYIDLSTTGSAWAWSSGATAVTLNQWNHVALVRNGGTTTSYINGVTSYSASSVTLWNPGTNLGIGAAIDGTTPYTGYISNLRVVKGTSLYSGTTITVPTSPLTAIANTSLLTCQSTTMIDNSNNAFTITANGDTKPRRFNPFGYTTSALQSYDSVVHGGSAYFDGTGDYLSVPSNAALTIGTSSATVEFWMYPTAVNGYRRIVTSTIGGFTSGSFIIRFNSGSFIAGDGTNTITAASVPIVNTWTHVAWVGVGGSTQALYFNGVRVGTSTTYNCTETIQYIGGYYSVGPDEFFVGYISNVRVTKGTALYTSSFVPPLTPLTAIRNTTLLLDSKPAILDYSMINNLETVGDVKISTSIKKYGSASMYFDGTGDNLKIIDNPNINFGSGDFTLECWVYFNVVNAAMTIISKGWQSSSAYASYLIYMTSGASLQFLASSSGGSWDIASERVIGTMTAGVWKHIAVTRSGTTFRAFVDGVINNSFTFTSSSSLANIAAQTLFLGSNNQGGVPLNGYIDDLRFTKGYARYTSAFTPPAAALDVK